MGWWAAERWQIPLLHSMHTMAKVKNLTLAMPVMHPNRSNG